MKQNGHKPPPPPEEPTNTVSKTPDDENKRVNDTLKEMEDSARLETLSDLELIAEIIDETNLSVDPRGYELMNRVYPDWHNEPSFQTLPKTPRFISFAVPFAVADAFATFNDCNCNQGFAPTEEQNRPCLYCACRAALYRATRNPVYRPDLPSDS
jgi:hypothetical protein